MLLALFIHCHLFFVSFHFFWALLTILLLVYVLGHPLLAASVLFPVGSSPHALLSSGVLAHAHFISVGVLLLQPFLPYSMNVVVTLHT